MEIALALLVIGVGVLIVICYGIRRDVSRLWKFYWLVNRKRIFEEQREDREWEKKLKDGIG